MNKIEVKKGNKIIFQTQTPEKWDELTGEQIRHFLYLKNTEASAEEVLKKISIYFLGKLPGNFPGINNAQLEDLCKQHLFLFEKTDLLKQVIPEFEIDGIKYVGPRDGLSNLRFWEYLKANEYFIKYVNKKSETDLLKFISCIYRPAKKSLRKDPESFNGDFRQKFNENLVEEHSIQLKRLSPETKEAITIFWKGCSLFIEKRFPEAFEGGEIKNSYGAYGLADNMAGPKFGTISQVKEAWLYEVLVSACQLEKMRKLNKK
ncbi:MAG TPA: hypothetical protein PKD91_09110 [Bacteroidia bacterium]|nr:hypothetical protein [Bacteroidia bacterium]